MQNYGFFASFSLLLILTFLLLFLNTFYFFHDISYYLRLSLLFLSALPPSFFLILTIIFPPFPPFYPFVTIFFLLLLKDFYSKEIGYEVLSKRLAANTTEREIVDYVQVKICLTVRKRNRRGKNEKREET